jgi:hypothetical protein
VAAQPQLPTIFARRCARAVVLAGLVGSLAAVSAGMITPARADDLTSSADNAQLTKVQIAMQRENMIFSSVSNVLKTKHDTAKNSIGNIR